MKIVDTIANPTISAMETASFGMQSSGKMFKMVISGLYSNKAQSITREIWSNAFDAHAMCGKSDVPFEVTLPSRWKSEFVVRDFGEGLSHEWMKQKYTIVGYSSKEDTNDAVGKWGVGRMSPLSYIDTFTVVSIHKGLKATYNVTMAADGAPQLNTLIPPMETDEPSGLRVSFPVKPEDFHQFKEAAGRVSLGLTVKPLVDGEPDYDWPTFELTSHGNGYSVYKKDYHTNVSGVLAKMGCVIYPINLTLCGIGASDQSLFNGMNLLLDVPIGSVEVTASREDLSYGAKEPTAKYLKSRLEGIKEDLTKDLQKLVDGVDSEYVAWKKVQNSGLPYALQKQVLFNNNQINEGYIVPRYFDTIEKDYRVVRKGGHYTTIANRSTVTYKGIIVGYKNGPDADTRLETRVRHYLGGSHRGKWIYCVCEWDKVLKKYDTSVYDDAVKFFQLDVTKVSDMPDVTITRKGGGKAKVYDFNWSEIEVDMDDGGVYVKSQNNVVEGINWNPNYSILNCCKGKTQVIANKTLWKKFENHDKWVDVTDAIKLEVTNRKDELNRISDLHYLQDDLFLEQYKDNLGGKFKQYYETLVRLKADLKNHPEAVKYGPILSSLRLRVPYEDAGKIMKVIKDDIFKSYPLIGAVGVHQVKRDVAPWVEYVKAMDYMCKNAGRV